MNFDLVTPAITVNRADVLGPVTNGKNNFFNTGGFKVFDLIGEKRHAANRNNIFGKMARQGPHPASLTAYQNNSFHTITLPFDNIGPFPINPLLNHKRVPILKAFGP